MTSLQKSRSWPGEYCVCVACGARTPHRRGVPWLGEPCPNCGKAMLRFERIGKKQYGQSAGIHVPLIPSP